MDKDKPGMGGRGTHVPGNKVYAERKAVSPGPERRFVTQLAGTGLGVWEYTSTGCLRRGAGAGATVTLGTGE